MPVNLMDCAWKISLCDKRRQHHTKLKLINGVGDKNQFNLRKLTCRISCQTVRFSEIRQSIFECLYIGNMFPESHGLVAMPVTSCIKIHVQIYPITN